MRLSRFVVGVNATALFPAASHAHVSEQGFVLLLPTDAYVAAGVAIVVLTIASLFVLSARAVEALFRFRSFQTPDFGAARDFVSLLSFLGMAVTVWIGLNGPRDPLSNLMPLAFWTLGWVALVSMAGVFGNIWVWINPWTGLYRLTGPVRPVLTVPERVGVWPATCVLLLFSAFLLADISPDDPARLAWRVLVYWGVMFAGLVLCGPGWLHRVELGHAVFAAYGSLAPLKSGPEGGVGMPGWRVLARPHSAGAGIFALTLLAVGSFDGLNETFWWLGLIGVNPLEFPGRSAVVWPTLSGIVVSVVLLIAVFAITVWLGLVLARSRAPFRAVFAGLALSVLPIALAYHGAHYLPGFLVAVQYVAAAVSDPLASGADWLGLQPFRVTTGFFNSIDTVRIIWTTQAGLVVFGHVWSVLLSHRIALGMFETERQARLATLPLSGFMIGYTFLGLWLLAAPRGA